MANNKNQHFVPKCHLKPFSDSKEKTGINLYNIKRNIFIRNASIKGQCAKDYFYGNDQKLESIFQNFEGNYATIVRSITEGASISDADLFFLMQFMHLQYFRTVMAAQRMNEGADSLRDEVYRDVSDKPDEDKPDEKQRIISLLRMCFSSMHLIEDLKICIIINKSTLDLLTSDDPVVFTNKFSFQKLNSSTFGMVNSGFMYVMPLSPKAAVMAYDGGVYSIEGKIGHKVILKDRSDIEALNELQYLKSHENIYFNKWSNREEIRNAFNMSKEKRLVKWFQSITMIHVKTSENVEKYRVGTDEERVNSNMNLIAVSPQFPRPSKWMSKIKYRNPLKAYNTGTGMGVVRIKDQSVLKEKMDRYRKS